MRQWPQKAVETGEMRMKGKLTLATLSACVLATTAAQAECVVADPTPTPLNARSAPYGRIVATLDNGQQVTIIDHSYDRQGRPWVYVSDSETDRLIGWVFRSFIVCKGQAPR